MWDETNAGRGHRTRFLPPWRSGDWQLQLYADARLDDALTLLSIGACFLRLGGLIARQTPSGFVCVPTGPLVQVSLTGVIRCSPSELTGRLQATRARGTGFVIFDPDPNVPDITRSLLVLGPANM